MSTKGALTSQQCVPCLIHGPGVICELQLLLVLFSAPGGFSLSAQVFPRLRNQHFQIPIRSTGMHKKCVHINLGIRSTGMHGHFWTSFFFLFGASCVNKHTIFKQRLGILILIKTGPAVVILHLHIYITLPFVWYLMLMQSVNRSVFIFVILGLYVNILLMTLQRSLFMPS